MQPDPTIHLWMHNQEVQRTMRQNALLRAVKEAGESADQATIQAAHVNPIRQGLTALLRVLRPAGTGGA